MTAAEAFNPAVNETIVGAVKAAEMRTSAEIRVYVEDHTGGTEAISRAWQHFSALHMHETAARNGVLVYVAVRDRKFAIIGDQGINTLVPAHFWEDVRDTMRTHFRAAAFAEGVSEAIAQTGKLLAQFFPRQHDDVNELSDDVVLG